MFSGIIEEQGIIQTIEKKRNLITLTLKADKVLRGVAIGDSISIDGVCLTVTSKGRQRVKFDVMKETLSATTFKYFRPQRKVNLERALKLSSRLGGHFVTGHIDGVGIIKKRINLPNYVEYMVEVDRTLIRYIVPKGSVSIDGISLTVGKVKRNIFSVYLIPHTLKVTTLGEKGASDKVNIETDILAKYVLEQKHR